MSLTKYKLPDAVLLFNMLKKYNVKKNKNIIINKKTDDLMMMHGGTVPYGGGEEENLNFLKRRDGIYVSFDKDRVVPAAYLQEARNLRR